jgi:hypothetical protein
MPRMVRNNIQKSRVSSLDRGIAIALWAATVGPILGDGKVLIRLWVMFVLLMSWSIKVYLWKRGEIYLGMLWI